MRGVNPHEPGHAPEIKHSPTIGQFLPGKLVRTGWEGVPLVE
jgi:hypothetical protein